jgi:hypothetical protein
MEVPLHWYSEIPIKYSHIHRNPVFSEYIFVAPAEAFVNNDFISCIQWILV